MVDSKDLGVSSIESFVIERNSGQHEMISILGSSISLKRGTMANNQLIQSIILASDSVVLINDALIHGNSVANSQIIAINLVSTSFSISRVSYLGSSGDTQRFLSCFQSQGNITALHCSKASSAQGVSGFKTKGSNGAEAAPGASH